MKIKKLWISRYKNIVDTTFEFKSDLITLLVGQNGLGKSNLLEVLALIFRDLDLLNDEEEFKDWPYDYENHFEYDINYECKGNDVRIQCLEGFFRVSRRDLNSADDFQWIDFGSFKRNKNKAYLPDYVIGYYSGENKRIRSIIKYHEEQVIKDLKANKGLEEGFRKLFFAENRHGQLLLLTILLYRSGKQDNSFEKAIQILIEQFTSFSELKEFGLQLISPRWFNKGNSAHDKWSVDFLEENIGTGNYAFWNSKGKVDKLLSLLYNSNDEPPIYYFEEKFYPEPHEVIDLNAIDFELVKSQAQKIFDTPLSFFDAFEATDLIEILSSIHLKVKSKSSDVTFDFRQLSEGEQQLITVLGLILITGEKDCLFLLDEPDTHLNPKWQRDYVDLLKQFNLNDDNSHIVVATHSPLIVQAAEDADILLYKKDENGIVHIINNDELKIHNWRIDQVLASEYFDFNSTRPPRLDGYMNLRERILSDGKLSAENEQNLKSLENEFGVLPTGETIDEIKSLLVIKNLARKIQ